MGADQSAPAEEAPVPSKRGRRERGRSMDLDYEQSQQGGHGRSMSNASDSEYDGGGNGGRDGGFSSGGDQSDIEDQRARSRQQRRKGRKRFQASGGRGEDDIAEGVEEEGEEPDMLNFNRDYEAPNLNPAGAGGGNTSTSDRSNIGSPATPAFAGSSGPSELQIGVLMLGDDEQYNEQLLGPGRQRDKGGKGLGTPVLAGIGIGEDLEELGEDDLKQFAFKTQAAAAAERMDYEYELPELSERLGSSLKLLTAGFDEAVMHIPHMRPTRSYNAYHLGPTSFSHEYGEPSALQYDEDGQPYYADERSMYAEPQSFGEEYQPVPLPFSEEEKQLQKAAAQRRRRKIKRELQWLKMQREAKEAAKEAQRLKMEEMEKSVNSRNSKSGRSTGAPNSARSSRRQSFAAAEGGQGGPRQKRGLILGNGGRSGMVRASQANLKPTGSMRDVGIRSSLAMSAGGGGGGNVRRSVASGGPSQAGSGYASPRG